MVKFLVRRLAFAVPTLIGVTLVVFMIVQVTPGDPAELMLGPMASEERVDDLRTTLGLDEPVIRQYGKWLARVLQGDFGYSFTYRGPVLVEILSKAGATAALVLSVVTIAGVLGILFGMTAGSRRGTKGDQALRIVSSFGISMPEFWLGMLLILFVSLRLGLLPSSGGGPPGVIDPNWAQRAPYIILPAITLALPQMAIVARLTRSSVVDVVGLDYVRTAKAKGLKRWTIIYRHVARNVMIPIVTLLGWQLGYLLGATVLVEVVFGWPGLGQLVVVAANSRDYPMIQGITLIVAVLVVLANIVVDATYRVIDPRVSSN